MPPIVSYSVNGTGIGHLIRQRALARAYVRLTGESRTNWLFVTSSDASDLVARDGFPTFKVPSKASLGRIEARRYKPLLVQTVKSVIAAIAPSVLVVDTFPNGAYNELSELNLSAKRALVARAVTDSFASRTGYHESLRRYDGLVLMSGVGDQQRTGGDGDAKILECGPIIDLQLSELYGAAAARRVLRIPDAALSVLVAFGGNDSDPLDNVLNVIVDVARQAPDTFVTIAGGPLRRRPELLLPSNVQWCQQAEISKHLRAFDIAVASSGFNTFHEILHAGLPAAFVPVPRHADDQRQRAAAAAAAGAAVWFEPDAVSPDAIRTLLSVWRDRSTREAVSSAARQLVSENCADVVAAWLRTFEAEARF